MLVESWWFLGMHVFWWMFWIVFLIWAFRWAMSKVKQASSGAGGTALKALQRMYAEGRITTQEYEERKANLVRDREVG